MDRQRRERLLEVGRSIVSELDPDALLAQILKVARELTGAQYAAVGVLDSHGAELSRFITSGIDAETAALIGNPPRGRGVLGTLISNPRPLRVDDVGEHPQSYGFPIGHPRMHSFLGVPILVRGQAWGNLYLTDKREGPFTADDEEAVIVLADWAAVAVANAGAYANQSARRSELERGVAAYKATQEIAQALAGETDLDCVLELVVKRGRALVGAASMVIELIEGDEAVVAATAGQVGRDLLGTRVPLACSMAGRVARSATSRRLTDLTDTVGAFGPADRIHANAGLFVPLLVRGRVIGVLAALDRIEDGPDFAEDDERLMEAFAASAASAVATAQSVATETVARAINAAEAERRRWARELHDETLQDIGALRLLLGAASQSSDPSELSAAVEEALGRLTVQADNLRSLIADLHPAALDQLGVEAAIDALLDRIHHRADLTVTREIDLAFEAGRAAERLAPAVELAAYRVVQEALTNVARHAGATAVDLTIREHDTGIDVIVTDDGCGFDPTSSAAGFGLVGMRERLSAVGGSLNVESRKGAGSTITARIPTERDPGAAIRRNSGERSGQRHDAPSARREYGRPMTDDRSLTS